MLGDTVNHIGCTITEELNYLWHLIGLQVEVVTRRPVKSKTREKLDSSNKTSPLSLSGGCLVIASPVEVKWIQICVYDFVLNSDDQVFLWYFWAV